MTTTRTGGPATVEQPSRIMKVGVAGLGLGATQVIRAMEQAPFLQITAAADVRPQALAAFQKRYGGKTYDSVAGLAKDPDVEVIWVSTPNRYHSEHTIVAAESGKHVVVEKPMAISLAEAERMVEAAERNKVKLLCGHTASLMAGFRAMRRVISSGRLGKVQAINCWSYVDWLFRPRMPEEIDLSYGGGTPFRQGPHQFDVVRLMGGGLVKSVRGSVREWMPFRPSPGYYTAFLEFEDGTPATVVKNGYGYFATTEFVPWAEPGRPAAGPAALRKALRAGQATDEAGEKEALRFGGVRERGGPAGGEGGTGFQRDAGIVIVSCERGDIRQAPGGLYIYDDDGLHEERVEGVGDERMAELDEMYSAILENRPVNHDGRWGMATLEVILAMLQSAKEGRELRLSHQVPAWE
jgi:phthalate 4,5-cis-dihydrodiol dehydrogenase